jgi:hypothetical protein
MDQIKLHDLRCFEAVATKGGFQAAGAFLQRSHPSVFAAVVRIPVIVGAYSTRWWAPVPRDRGQSGS